MTDFEKLHQNDKFNVPQPTRPLWNLFKLNDSGNEINIECVLKMADKSPSHAIKCKIRKEERIRSSNTCHI